MKLIKTISLDEVFADPKKIKHYCDKSLLLSDMITGIGANGTLCCPFHNDSRPSAKIYRNEDGSETLYCFTEDKQYTSYDYLTRVLQVKPVPYLIKHYSHKDLEDQLRTIDFSDSSEAQQQFNKTNQHEETIVAAREALPDIILFFETLYPTAIKASNG